MVFNTIHKIIILKNKVLDCLCGQEKTRKLFHFEMNLLVRAELGGRGL